MGEYSLPVLELCKETDAAGIEALRLAAHETGFFYLKGAIDEDVCLRCAAAAREFFERTSDDEKQRYSYEASSAFRGFMALGKETTKGQVDAREQIEIGPEGGDVRATSIADRLRGPNIWPPGLREVTEAWLAACRHVAERLVRLLALALGLPADTLERRVVGDEPHFQAKLAFYPSGGAQGVGPHTDSGLLTLLWQDSTGLEVLSGSSWLSAPPIPDTIVCNLGEMLQLASGGYLKATPHRVTSSSSSPRISLPYFYNPSLDAVVDPVLTEADLDTLPWNRKRTKLDDDDDEKNRLHRAYGLNAFKSLARSHPAVFRRHHPDLQLLDDGTVVPLARGD